MHNVRTALLTVLDQVDYTSGACGLTEMVSAVLPREIIGHARKALADNSKAKALTKAQSLRLANLYESAIACRASLSSPLTSAAEKERIEGVFRGVNQEFTELLFQLAPMQ